MAVLDDPRSRPSRDALVRGLLAHGRFTEALQAARRFVELDPDLAAARQLLAYALTVNGDAAGAALAIDSLTEGAAKDAPAHERAARALEAVGDEQRACAHWRSLAELRRSDDAAAFEALRCRARVFGQSESVLKEIRDLARRPPRLEQLTERVTSGQVPRFDPVSGNMPIAASVRCSPSDQACPAVILIAPDGSVASPWTPPSARTPMGVAAAAAVRDGTYRMLLVGGATDANGEVEIRALETAGKFPFSSAGAVQTIAVTTISGVADFPFGGYWDYVGG
jgi:Ca-activated chloride channel family protein